MCDRSRDGQQPGACRRTGPRRCDPWSPASPNSRIALMTSPAAAGSPARRDSRRVSEAAVARGQEATRRLSSTRRVLEQLERLERAARGRARARRVGRPARDVDQPSRLREPAGRAREARHGVDQSGLAGAGRAAMRPVMRTGLDGSATPSRPRRCRRRPRSGRAPPACAAAQARPRGRQLGALAGPSTRRPRRGIVAPRASMRSPTDSVDLLAGDAVLVEQHDRQDAEPADQVVCTCRRPRIRRDRWSTAAG